MTKGSIHAFDPLAAINAKQQKQQPAAQVKKQKQEATKDNLVKQMTAMGVLP